MAVSMEEIIKKAEKPVAQYALGQWVSGTISQIIGNEREGYLYRISGLANWVTEDDIVHVCGIPVDQIRVGETINNYAIIGSEFSNGNIVYKVEEKKIKTLTKEELRKLVMVGGEKRNETEV